MIMRAFCKHGHHHSLVQTCLLPLAGMTQTYGFAAYPNILQVTHIPPYTLLGHQLCLPGCLVKFQVITIDVAWALPHCLISDMFRVPHLMHMQIVKTQKGLQLQPSATCRHCHTRL